MGIARRSASCEGFIALLANVDLQDKTHAARDLSGLVNEAYNTLLRPLSRIHYILSQHNLSISETDQLDDPDLITEVIEIREALEDASSESEVGKIRNDVTGLHKTIYSAFGIS